MTRKERHERAELKKEAIKKEIYEGFLAIREEDDAQIKINKAIDIMMKRNPSEAHLVHSVCMEIRLDNAGYITDMVSKYGVNNEKTI
jgi:hypothetical protein